MIHINQRRRKPSANVETIFEAEARLKKEAAVIAKNHVHTKPIKYLLKK
jgi:hypothetical protein